MDSVHKENNTFIQLGCITLIRSDFHIVKLLLFFVQKKLLLFLDHHAILFVFPQK